MSRTQPGYLDAAATAPLRPEARAAMTAVWDEGQANASSVHAAGARARATVEHARAQIAAALGARPAELVFTSGGTEANALALTGLALARPRGRHLIVSAIEHSSVLESARFLERVFGFELTVLPVDDRGRVSLAAVDAALREDTTLLSIGLANGEIGTVQSLTDIAAAAHARGALVHSDAVQAAATLPVSFSDRGLAASEVAGQPAPWPGAAVDALTIASHKFGGPQGVGALLVRTRFPLEPLLHGGGQERGLRSGTENVAGIAGFGAAVTAAHEQIGRSALALMRSRDALIAAVTAGVPGASLSGDPVERLPGHASFTIAGVSGESLLVALDAAGLAVSSGSACAAGRSDPSPTLLALGVSPELAQSALRFTLPNEIPHELIDRVVEVLRAEVERAQAPRLARYGSAPR